MKHGGKGRKGLASLRPALRLDAMQMNAQRHENDEVETNTKNISTSNSKDIKTHWGPQTLKGSFDWTYKTTQLLTEQGFGYLHSLPKHKAGRPYFGKPRGKQCGG